MIRVDQTVMTMPGGNCFSACVASLFHLSISEVPYFMGDFKEPLGTDGHHPWWKRFHAWLRPRGFYALEFSWDPLHDDADAPVGYYILNGKSPRGDYEHSVIAHLCPPFHPRWKRTAFAT